MKLAVSGKGGTGKTTLAAALALLMGQRGRKVLAVDADPDANLAGCLGLPPDKMQQVQTIAHQARLIEERTGAQVRQYGQMFKLNPRVEDIARTYAVEHDGVALLVLGAVEQGGDGCACPESVLLRALVADLVLRRDDALIMDMEAGVEHLGRATAQGVDAMLVVVEPGHAAIDCARRVMRMAADIGVTQVHLVANKVASNEDEAFIRSAFPEPSLLGVIPWSSDIIQADRTQSSVLQALPATTAARFELILAQLDTLAARGIRGSQPVV